MAANLRLYLEPIPVAPGEPPQFKPGVPLVKAASLTHSATGLTLSQVHVVDGLESSEPTERYHEARGVLPAYLSNNDVLFPLTLRKIDLRPAPGMTGTVEADCVWQYDYQQVEIASTGEPEKVWLDNQGQQIEVEYKAAAEEETRRKARDVEVFRVALTIRVTYWTTLEPIVYQRIYAGKVNAAPMLGLAERTVRCLSVRGRTEDGGRLWEITMDFAWRAKGWTVPVYYSMGANEPLVDAVEGNGRATFLPYQDFDAAFPALDFRTVFRTERADPNPDERVVEDLVGEGSETFAGSQEVQRAYRVLGTTGRIPERLQRALDLVPQYGDTMPGADHLWCVKRTAVVEDPSCVRVELTYQGVSPGKWWRQGDTMDTSTQGVELSSEAVGSQMIWARKQDGDAWPVERVKVDAKPPATKDNEDPEPWPTQHHTIQAEVPQASMSVVQRSKSCPLDLALNYTGTINYSEFAGSPAKTLMCRGVRATSRDGGLTWLTEVVILQREYWPPAGLYGWMVPIWWIEDDGQPGAEIDKGTGNGWTLASVYQETEFAGLGLPDEIFA